ncbi:lysylphosphatidylglycerol synthase domain-containing protein [Pseudomonas subflava]|uniref:lysylphosphatidylglycerol synthase domain-containing protein n=1 Tax=Pseudomonas subflava TaxID=2952933 RepID=UPI002079714E|nr:lysylphosphatidylglycerol synthase domain-containing protein [Pseudomonas subflava]
MTQQNQPKPWIKWGKRLLTVFFFIMVPVLLFMLVKNLEWNEVVQALQSYSMPMLLACVGITAVSFTLFASYDLLGRAYTGHHLPAKQILPLTFVCYAFNLNLSSWVGAIALRYRLYSRLGLGVATVTRILTFSLITNWLGYMILAGIVFSLRLVQLPENWQIGATALQAIGIGLLLVCATYLLACRFARRRSWSWRDHEVTLPSLKLALAQAGMSMCNWSLSSLLIFLLLPKGVDYPTVLGIMLVSSIAGVVTHIPAGLGVLEAVFIAMLEGQASKGAVLAALIGYRAIYLLLPLLVAVVVYLVLEKRAKKLRQKSEQAGRLKTEGA